MAALLRSELFRLWRRAMPRVLLLILAGVIVLLYLALWAATGAGEAANTTAEQTESLRENLRVAAVRNLGLTLVVQVGTVLAVILAASSIGSEFGWGTLRTILPRSQGRTAFLAAKVVSSVLFVILVVLVGFLVALAASAAVTAVENLGGGLGEQFWPRTLASLGRAMYTMLPYVAIALAVAVLAKSTAAGIGVGLAVLFIEGPLTTLVAAAGGIFEDLPKALLSSNVAAVLRPNAAGIEDGAATGGNLLNPWAAAGVLALYTVVALALAFWRFRGRDITSS